MHKLTTVLWRVPNLGFVWLWHECLIYNLSYLNVEMHVIWGHNLTMLNLENQSKFKCGPFIVTSLSLSYVLWVMVSLLLLCNLVLMSTQCQNDKELSWNTEPCWPSDNFIKKQAMFKILPCNHCIYVRPPLTRTHTFFIYIKYT